MSHVGAILKAVVGWFVWKLHLLSCRTLMTGSRASSWRRTSDYAAWLSRVRSIWPLCTSGGRAAYVWLLLAALCEAAAALAALIGSAPFISGNAVLHMYLSWGLSRSSYSVWQYAYSQASCTSVAWPIQNS